MTEHQENTDTEQADKDSEQIQSEKIQNMLSMSQTAAERFLHLSDNMEPTEIAAIQAEMERNPEAFSDVQREKVKDLTLKMTNERVKVSPQNISDRQQTGKQGAIPRTLPDGKPWYTERWEVRPFNDTLAKGMLSSGGNLTLQDIGNIQKAMELNPSAYSEAQQVQIKDLSWKIIDSVAKGEFVLDPRQCNHFKYIMDNIPPESLKDENRLKTLKAAEQKWYDADTMTGERKLLTFEEWREACNNGRVKRNPRINDTMTENKAIQTKLPITKSSSMKKTARKIRQLRGLSPSSSSKQAQNLHVQQRPTPQFIMPRTGGRI